MNNQIDIIGVLENRNSKLKVNHRIGSRDIANQELKEISTCIDNLMPHIRKAVEKAKKYDDKEVFKDVSLEEIKEQTLKVLPQEYNVILDLITGKIDDILGYLGDTNHHTDVVNYWINRKKTLTDLYEKLKNQQEIENEGN